jgi:hypothetical protein
MINGANTGFMLLAASLVTAGSTCVGEVEARRGSGRSQA